MTTSGFLLFTTSGLMIDTRLGTAHRFVIKSLTSFAPQTGCQPGAEAREQAYGRQVRATKQRAE
eukprot:scaffold280899_cov35-Prasinocladus_malaysianus.AAC.1